MRMTNKTIDMLVERNKQLKRDLLILAREVRDSYLKDIYRSNEIYLLAERILKDDSTK